MNLLATTDFDPEILLEATAINIDPNILLQGFVLLYFWSYFSIFCHEMGHFICARRIGFNPYSVRIGSGVKLLRIKFDLFL